MLGPVNVAWPQVGGKQVLATKNIARQKAVMVIVSVKEAAFLLAVDGIVGGSKSRTISSGALLKDPIKTSTSTELSAHNDFASTLFSKQHRVEALYPHRVRQPSARPDRDAMHHGH